MRVFVRTLSVFALAFLVAGARAEDKKPADKKDDKKPAVTPFANTFTFPKTITLTEEQQKKIDDLKKEYTPKLVDVQKKLDTIETPERKKARAEALKKAKADNIKGKELTKLIDDAVKYTDDEKKQLKDIGAERGKLFSEIQKKKMEVLTDEQKKALQPKPKTEPKKTEK